MIRIEPPVVQWQSIAAFPKYEMNMQGEVRNEDSGIRVQPAKFDGVDYVELMREGKPFLLKVNRLLWDTFPLAGFPPIPSDIERHGAWDQTRERYEDGEGAHMCGMVCSVGEV
jgi:hypothetical protein